MKEKYFSHYIILALLVLASVVQLNAQDSLALKKIQDGWKPAPVAFDGTWIIDNHSAVVPSKGSVEFMIQHRFGQLTSGLKDLYGLYLPSNIRFGLSYTPFGNLGVGRARGPLMIGINTTKNNRILDVFLKYNFLQQTRNNRIPVSVSYLFVPASEMQKSKDELPNKNQSDRISYFNQIIIARRFSDKLSAQVAPSISHFNVVEPGRKNDHIAVAFCARYKFSAQSAVIINADQPITKHKVGNPQPNLSFGVEIATSGHVFQVFATNFTAISPQHNNQFNQNDPWNKGWAIGFNINRLWSF